MAFAPALALSLVTAPASASPASASPASASTASRAALAAARAVLDHLSVGRPAAARRPARQVRPGGDTTVSSTEWGGYADIDRTYSEVSGKWKQPATTCTSTTSLAAFWVGIDGYSSDSVEQAGTLTECYLDTAYYYTWWEMYLSNDIQVVGDTVQPGDVITASVSVSGSDYTLKVTDSTHPANSFTATATCSGCADSSAEWIVEAQSGYPVARFSQWTGYGATVKSGSTTGVISTFPYVKIEPAGGTFVVGPLNSAGMVSPSPGGDVLGGWCLAGTRYVPRC